VSVFFDTNVLVYCTDSFAPDKQSIARRLVAEAGMQGAAVTSTQVLIELFNVLTRKQKIPSDAAQALVLAYTSWPIVHSDLALVTTAIQHVVQHRFSVWDAMVIEAALRAEARTLYTEDLTHGQQFGKLTVVNPFQ
jgi:predicted nucleic acid-binding protein